MRNEFCLLVLIGLLSISSLSYAVPEPFFFKGYVHVDGALAANGTIVEAFKNNATTATATVTVGQGLLVNTREGWYTIAVEGDSNNTIIFKVNGVSLIATNGTDNTTQVLGTNRIINDFNLSINKSASGAACTYAVGCTGGYCVHNLCRSASTYCGDGYCDTGESCSTDNSACSSGYACTNGCVATGGTTSTGGGGGGGGAATTLPSVTQTVASISANVPTTVIITETKLPISNIELTTSANVQNVQLTVKEVSQPSGISVAIASDAGKTYKYIEINTTVGSQLTKAKIKFKIEKIWFTANKIDSSTIALNRLVGTAWTKLSTTKVSEDATNVYYEAETGGFSTFAITGEKVKAAPAAAVCGNGIIESGEECDENQFVGQTCITKGFDSGTLKCTNCLFDTSACTSAAQPPGQPAETPPIIPFPGILTVPGDNTALIAAIIIIVVIILVYILWVRPRGRRNQYTPSQNPSQ